MVNNIEMGFYFTIGRCDKIYDIETLDGIYLASIYRIIGLKQNCGNQMYISFDYELEYNKFRKLSEMELRMVNILFHNLVNMITHDMQTIYVDNINERLNLPFYSNIIKVIPKI